MCLSTEKWNWLNHKINPNNHVIKKLMNKSITRNKLTIPWPRLSTLRGHIFIIEHIKRYTLSFFFNKGNFADAVKLEITKPEI